MGGRIRGMTAIGKMEADGDMWSYRPFPIPVYLNGSVRLEGADDSDDLLATSFSIRSLYLYIPVRLFLDHFFTRVERKNNRPNRPRGEIPTFTRCVSSA